ncbi:MAG: glycosyl hydrolase [Terracoccus sp.]
MSASRQAPRRSARPRSTALLAVLTLLGAFALTAATMTSAQALRPVAAAAMTQGSPAPHAKSPRPVTSAVTFGVAEPGAPTDLSGVRTLTTQLGQAPSLVMWYVAWSSRTDFPSADVRAVAASGATPEITWEPWDPASGADQPAYRLAAIANGAHDAYISRWAGQARAARTPVVLRFGHEMNGSWYPWAEQANGNAPGDFVRAYRHVHDLFVAARATNVTWAWSPNVSFPGSTPVSGLYPGDGYVDQVALTDTTGRHC